MSDSFEEIVSDLRDPTPLFEQLGEAYNRLDQTVHSQVPVLHHADEMIDTTRALGKGVTRRVTFERRWENSIQTEITIDARSVGEKEMQGWISYTHPNAQDVLYFRQRGFMHFFSTIHKPELETQLAVSRPQLLTQDMALILLRWTVEHVTQEIDQGISSVDVR